MHIGGLIGFASISSGNNIEIDKPNINLGSDLDKLVLDEGRYDVLAVGGAFGKLQNSSSSTESITTLSSLEVIEPMVTVSMNAKDNKFVTFNNVGIGGMIGLLEGSQPNNLFKLDGIAISALDQLANVSSVYINNNGILYCIY